MTIVNYHVSRHKPRVSFLSKIADMAIEKLHFGQLKLYFMVLNKVQRFFFKSLVHFPSYHLKTVGRRTDTQLFEGYHIVPRNFARGMSQKPTHLHFSLMYHSIICHAYRKYVN